MNYDLNKEKRTATSEKNELNNHSENTYSESNHYPHPSYIDIIIS